MSANQGQGEFQMAITKYGKGKLNPAWVEQLQGVPVGWTNVYAKGQIDDYAKIRPCEDVCLLWSDPSQESVQRTIRRLWSFSTPEILWQGLLQIEQDNTESEQIHPPVKGKGDTDVNVPGLPNKGRPSAPPPRYCQLRQCGSSLPEMPCTIAYCKWHMGGNEQQEGSLRIDRLRLLGNGVVPQCAEKAIRELMGLLMQGSDDGGIHTTIQ
jgi:hypothetical protein